MWQWCVLCLLGVISGANSISNNTSNITDSEQSEQIDRFTVENSISLNLTAIPENVEKFNLPETLNKTAKVDLLSDFKPSPPLQTYQEYTKPHPLVPASPEPKRQRFSSGFNLGEIPSPTSSRWSEPEKPWMVRFPSSNTNVPKIKERPYEFDRGSTSNGKTFVEKNRAPINHKSEFDFTAPVGSFEKPYKSGFDFSSVEKYPHYEVQQHNPWKKIIKFLTALIPLGLLISALTPTIISVTPMNSTIDNESRYRAGELINPGAKRLITASLGCEQRILCELLSSAGSSGDGEQHAQNLLDTFTKDGNAVEKAEEMRRIFEAIRNGDCASIRCEKIDDKTA